MVEHMEAVHRMFQNSRRYSLEDYVEFGCARGCHLTNEFTRVQKWAGHFSDNFTQCDKDSCSADTTVVFSEPAAVPAKMPKSGSCLSQSVAESEMKRDAAKNDHQSQKQRSGAAGIAYQSEQ